MEILLELTSIMDNRRFALNVEEIAFNEKDPGNPTVDIEGYFQSPRGTGFHLTDFFELEKRFNNSALLTPAEQITAIPAADKGVRFSIKLKKKENV